ncbi:TPA: aminopeptidase P family protein [Enterobacter ludwigii]|uniref:M24 family metallopeptidase n=1 Tax=Raoultella planticola TaxID=575 RepID=A0ABU5MCE7_RAOPL|nr:MULTISPECIES: aminopeptidase P family protein [Enterobacteriaceae]QFH72060.1 M24 family metallopeptidase [Enterobacter sp. E76]HDH1871666.1 M24 family metallopeptidase [Klebsiella quasipneumoniae subsp. similipneumoniae]HDV9415815.1 M24 family metallopeptidase [Raoultella ornithinolytica]MBG2619783.1 M24 family metallopeptidase [Klebsiella michiganensis]MBG2634313.1 M24 family metallopeptidase [Klebsiella michiganensis]
MNKKSTILKEVIPPHKDCSGIPVMLTDETIDFRRNKIITKMKENGLEQLVIYGDVEHGSNFEYLVGFFTRFEEALLVVKANGDMTLVLGNENLNKASKSRVLANAVHVPEFSLPNQPNIRKKDLDELFIEAGIQAGLKVGLVGWKLFTNNSHVNKNVYDLPSYVVDVIRRVVGNDDLISNETDLFIGKNGVRTTNNANEVAHYEYGAALASDCMLDAMNRIEPGVTEQELGECLVRSGQHTNIVTIASSGERFINANLFPTNNIVKIGDAISLTVGYRGGASSRAGYAVNDDSDLPDDVKSYLDAVAIPYFSAYTHWLDVISIGMSGGELFEHVEDILPRAVYKWSLCPGHLVADEEWMSSPVYEGSEDILTSGMILQIDIIPSIPGFGGVSAESTVLLADKQLQLDIQNQYPELWHRMQVRRDYLIEKLGIRLSPDIFPMCSTVAYLRPYLLNKKCALVNVN